MLDVLLLFCCCCFGIPSLCLIVFTSSGRCLQQLTCRARVVQSGSQAGQSCRCSNRRCHYCLITPTSEVCRTCRDGWYLLGTECIQSCPAEKTSAGVSLFARRCLDPFICRGTTILGFEAAFGCRCPAPGNGPNGNCHECAFAAGTTGDYCSTCNNNKLLFQGACLDTCAGTGLADYPSGNYGSECRPPFRCYDGFDIDGSSCGCSRDLGGDDCVVCEYAVVQRFCHVCGNFKLLSGATCVDQCPGGQSPIFAGSATGIGGRC